MDCGASRFLQNLALARPSRAEVAQSVSLSVYHVATH